MPKALREGFPPASVARLLTAILLVISPAPAAGHAILVHSSLQDGPVQPETPTGVTLRFNAAIEVTLSRALLVTGKGEERPLSVAPGARPGEMLVRLPALPAGRYGLRYKVLAADGHLTDDIVRFSISVPR